MITATGKKVETATIERPLSRGSPQSMCPDVQPLDILKMLAFVPSCRLRDATLTLVPNPMIAPNPKVTNVFCRDNGMDG